MQPLKYKCKRCKGDRFRKEFENQVKFLPFLSWNSWKANFYASILSIFGNQGQILEMSYILMSQLFLFKILDLNLVVDSFPWYIIIFQNKIYFSETNQSEKIRDDKNGNNFLGRIAEVLEVLWISISLICRIHLSKRRLCNVTWKEGCQ